MPEQRLNTLLDAARTRVCRVQLLLQRPLDCSVDECVTLLREAQGYLEWLRDSLQAARSVPQNLRTQAVVLAGEIRRAAILLDQAARFGCRWLERLQTAAGYTARGIFPPLEVRGNIAIFG